MLDHKIVHLDPRQAELVERVSSHASIEGVNPTAYAPLSLIRMGEATQPLPSVYSPSFCLVVQGRKRAIIGGETYYYDPFHYLLVSLTLPILGQVLDATPDRPYLCMRIDIDIQEVARLLLEIPTITDDTRTNTAFYVGRVSSEIIDIALRLVRLIDSPRDAGILGPLALRELWYRLLCSEMGARLRNLIELDGPVQRVSRAIQLLQQRFHEPLSVEHLARTACMSVSTFHARFKAVTSMSPLQFQKTLRLHEARRLLLSQQLDATAVAHRVGYESPSQFSREYRRLFGAPPRQETALLRSRAARES